MRQVADVMQSVGVWWAVAGGWAIDLLVGRQTRDHHDVEVVVRRADQAAVRDSLRNGWELLCLDPPGSEWTPWLSGSEMVQPSFQLKARASGLEFDLFLESMTDDTWCFRRDDRVRRPIDRIVARAPASRSSRQRFSSSTWRSPRNPRTNTTSRWSGPCSTGTRLVGSGMRSLLSIQDIAGWTLSNRGPERSTHVVRRAWHNCPTATLAVLGAAPPISPIANDPVPAYRAPDERDYGARKLGQCGPWRSSAVVLARPVCTGWPPWRFPIVRSHS